MTLKVDAASFYEPWSGAVNTWDKLREHFSDEEIWDVLDEFTNEINADWTIEEFNDFLWFEPEQVFELFGLSDDGEMVADDDEEDDEY